MKTHIRIIVQESKEPAGEFAKRIEKYCTELSALYPYPNHHNYDFIPQVKFMTTASNGLQTATIQFFSDITPQ